MHALSVTPPHQSSPPPAPRSPRCRPYLQQRSHAAVCYLNTAGVDFEGGAFRFQGPAPPHTQQQQLEVLAAPGRVVAYSADEVHSVSRLAAGGERHTLTLWFTEDPQHCEDASLLRLLRQPDPGEVRGGAGRRLAVDRAPPAHPHTSA